MPTVVDALIVTLGLDPSGFTEGQRQMANSLRAMETGAERAATNIERRGAGIVTFFRALESPLGTIRQHFERMATVTTVPQRNLLNLAQQGRRTGQEVEAGALQGAAGLRAMGVAGLTAVAAFIALDKVRSAATDSARNLFGASIGAAGAGIPISQYTAISQALLHGGNVPEAETQGWLSQIRSAQVQAQHGDPSAAAALAANLAKIGVNANAFTDSPEAILLKVAERFHSVSADVAIGLGDMVGESAALSLALHNLGDAGLQEQIQLERQRSATEGQTQAAKDLTLAQANLDISWQNLERRIGEEIDPALAAFDNLLSRVLDRFTGAQAKEVARTFGLSLIPGGSAVASGWNLWDRAKGWLGFGGSSLGGSARGGSAAPSRSSSFTPSGGTDVDAIRSAVAAAGGNEATQAAFLAMFSAEDGSKLNPSGVEGGGTSGVGGRGGASWAQWTASRRRQLEAFGWTGHDPIKDREAASKMLYWELTTNPQFVRMLQQMNAAGDPTAAAIIGGRAFEQGGDMNASDFGGGGFSQSGLDHFHSSQANAWYQMIKSAMSRASAAVSNFNQHVDIDVNGGVHVHNTGQTPGQAGAGIGDALGSQIMANAINSGQG